MHFCILGSMKLPDLDEAERSFLWILAVALLLVGSGAAVIIYRG